MTVMTRRQLYELIWSKPMRDAAADIGISDVGLKKVCVRHRVPVPPQGYWNKVHAGQTPPKTIFRDVDDPRLNRVKIEGSNYNPPPEVKSALEAAKAAERLPERKIEVSTAAAPTLPAAVRLAAALGKGHVDEKGLACAVDRTLFHVAVASANINRAVAIVEALLVAATARGHAATTGSEHLTLVVEGEPIVLALKETTKRGSHVRTQEELDREDRRAEAARKQNWALYSRLHRPEPKWDYRATGQLFLEIEGKEYLNVRTRWSDTTSRKLDTMLNDVLAGLTAYAAARKQRKAEQERRQREWQLQQEREADARRRAELEKARVEFLEQRLRAFDEMNRLARFLGRLSNATHWQEPPPRFQEFVQWAEQRVQRLRRQCSAESLQEALSESSLFGSNPRPSTNNPYYGN